MYVSRGYDGESWNVEDEQLDSRDIQILISDSFVKLVIISISKMLLILIRNYLSYGALFAFVRQLFTK